MTLQRDAVSDLFGLCGRFPLPGWVVLDAARAHRFTGQLTFDIYPAVRLYLDRGRIYLAERVTDPPLGDRLVDSGALTPVQLAHGALRVGETEHLGRLFERVPAIDREIVLLTTELMNDTCVAWVAGQEVPAVLGTPYLHHPSGIHRWDRPADAVDLRPGDPLPAPAPTDAPLPTPEEPIPDGDPLISWDLSSWLDERAAEPHDHEPPPSDPTLTPPPLATPDTLPPSEPTPDPTAFASAPTEPPSTDVPSTELPSTDVPSTELPSTDVPSTTLPSTDVPSTELPTTDPAPAVPPAAHDPVADPALGQPVDRTPEATTSILETDWADRLESDGLPVAGDPLTAPAQLSPAHVGPPDRFELIWPSGEIDEDFGVVAAVEGDLGQDRVGPTARVVRSVDVLDDLEPLEEPAGLWDFEATGPLFGPAPAPPAADALTTPSNDEAVLSMRRAIDSIEADAQAQRTDTSSPIADVAPVRELDVPGRVATRSESSVWTVPASDPDRKSVFDEVTADAPVEHAVADHPAATNGTASAPEADRVSALRRLIGGLRRR